MSPTMAAAGGGARGSKAIAEHSDDTLQRAHKRCTRESAADGAALWQQHEAGCVARRCMRAQCMRLIKFSCWRLQLQLCECERVRAKSQHSTEAAQQALAPAGQQLRGLVARSLRRSGTETAKRPTRRSLVQNKHALSRRILRSADEARLRTASHPSDAASVSSSAVTDRCTLPTLHATWPALPAVLSSARHCPLCSA